MSRRDYITPVAKQIPFDNATSRGYLSTDKSVQEALEGLRDHTIYVSETRATTASGTLTMTTANKNMQFLTGSATGYTVRLPDATTLVPGAYYQVANTTSQSVNVTDSTGTILEALSQNSIGYFTLQLNNTAAGSWLTLQTIINTATGIVSYKLTSTAAFNTTSTSDVLITGFTLTPQAGTYAIWYNASSFLTTTPKAHWWSLYKAGVKITDSERTQDTAHSNQNMVDTTMTTQQFNGSQSIDVRVRTSNGTLTINARTIILIRLGA